MKWPIRGVSPEATTASIELVITPPTMMQGPDSGNWPHSCAPANVCLELLLILATDLGGGFPSLCPPQLLLHIQEAEAEHWNAAAEGIESHISTTSFSRGKTAQGNSKVTSTSLWSPRLVQEHLIGELNSHAE